MTGQDDGRVRVTFWIILIGFLGLVAGAVISGALNYRGSNLKEVTRVVEVTREVIVDRPIEVTRLVVETRVVEVTRIVEVAVALPMLDSLADQRGEGSTSETTGSIIIGVLLNDGRTAIGTHSVALFPKTLIDAAGESQPDRDQEIDIPVNVETGFAEAYGLEAGTYVACLRSLLHTATVGEIDIATGEITRVDLYWPPEVTRINAECILDS